MGEQDLEILVGHMCFGGRIPKRLRSSLQAQHPLLLDIMEDIEALLADGSDLEHGNEVEQEKSVMDTS